MSKTAYNLQLKGYVSGADFDRKAVDNMLAANAGKQVNVLIDSTGGNLATGLSLTSAFKNHGVYDDFVTTGATMISMRNLLHPLGYNLFLLHRNFQQTMKIL